jgi:hypothetical protein
VRVRIGYRKGASDLDQLSPPESRLTCGHANSETSIAVSKYHVGKILNKGECLTRVEQTSHFKSMGLKYT